MALRRWLQEKIQKLEKDSHDQTFETEVGEGAQKPLRGHSMNNWME